jgi:hypothetical protein
MMLKQKLLLLLLGMFIAWVSAWWIKAPGYMDADYYFATAKHIASGDGFSEPFVWNFLDHPAEIPHAAFQYWMPMTSFLATLSQMIFGLGFRAAQLPFIVLTALLPLFSAWIAYKLHEDAQLAWQSGLLASVPGFYLPFFVTTDAFSIYAFLGPFWFLSVVLAFKKGQFLRWFIPGILAGIAHLTRADGILFLLLGLFVVIYIPSGKPRAIGGMISGYLLIMVPWWILNWTMTGTLMAAGTGRILWATTYDELFAYPPEKITFQRWIQSDFGNILMVRIQALWANLKNLLFVNGVIFLSPLMFIGAWNQRRTMLLRLVFFYLILLLLLMSFVFPFAGSRGGFFHSSTAVMPILWVFAPLGLKIAIDKGVEIRNWQREQAMGIFVPATFILAAVVTLALLWTRAVGADYFNPGWSSEARIYEEAAHWFEERGVEQTVVAVNNPPGFYAQSKLQAVVIPDGDEDTLRLVVDQFEVEWVLLDSNYPAGLKELYEDPQSSDWLELVDTLEKMQGMKIFVFKVNLE